MTPEQLRTSLLAGSVVGIMLQLPGGGQLQAVITANLQTGHAVAISADVAGPGVCYRLTAFRAE